MTETSPDHLRIGIETGDARGNRTEMVRDGELPDVEDASARRERLDRRMAGNATWLFAGQAAVLAAGLYLVLGLTGAARGFRLLRAVARSA